MPAPPQALFEQFVRERKDKLRWIAHKTQQEHTLSDVTSEAWLMAHDWKHKTGIPLNLGNHEHQDLLISHLYNKLVKFTEQKIRNGVRLDHAPPGAEDTDQPHPLLQRLSGPAEDDPLALHLAEEEEHQYRAAEPDCHHSIASAYMHLLRHFNNRMSAVAAHLLISVSWSYRCCARARLLAEWQQPMSLKSAIDSSFLPGPWRRFQISMPPEQLMLDFGASPSLLD